MRTPICDELGIEFPIFAFTHCRDVVVAVSKAGGFGVLGAVGFSPEQLEIELNWIDEHIGDRPYGVDIVIPNKYEGMDADMSTEELTKMLQEMVPQGHLDFARKLLNDHGVPTPEGEDNSLKLLGWTEATATPQVEIALQHPKMMLIANALGTPPADMIEHIHAAGRKVAALCGSPYQATQARRRRRRHHHRPGRRRRRPLRRGRLDRALAAGGQGGRAGAGARRRRDRQRRADRRRARARLPGRVVGFAVADGRGVREHAGAAGHLREGLVARHRAEPFVHRQAVPHAAQRLDRGLGEPRATPTRSACRCSTWCRAWRSPATHRYPDQSVDVAFNPVGQVVGQFEKVEKTAAVIQRWVEEYLEAVEHLNSLNAAAGV